MTFRDWKPLPLFAIAALVPTLTDRIEREDWPSGVGGWLTEIISGMLILLIGTIALRRIAMDRAALHRANEELRRLAHTDALTGLGNRTAWQEALRRWDASPVPQWLLVADVDRLKPVNDLKGHAAGDALLIRASAALLATASPACGSVVFRTGGDEFAVVLATEDAATAEWAAARLLGAMRDDPDGASFSVGLAFLDPAAGSALEAAGRADAALYLAKRSGGGEWRVARSPHPRRNRAEETG